jgi:hypothetical protein
MIKGIIVSSEATATSVVVHNVPDITATPRVAILEALSSLLVLVMHSPSIHMVVAMGISFLQIREDCWQIVVLSRLSINLVFLLQTEV